MNLDFGGLIPIAGGLYGLLAAFGVVRISKTPQGNQLWIEKFGKAMKILCPLVILFGIAELFGLLR